MINNFRNIGKEILKRSGYYDSTDESKRRQAFLSQYTLLPLKKNKGISRAVLLNFDLDRKEFRFELDKELVDQNRGYFFAFKVGTPNDQKKFLATNNIESFINQTFTDTLQYLEKRRADKKSAAWFQQGIPSSYDELMAKVRDTFYRKERVLVKDKEEEIFNLDEKLLVEDQRAHFLRVKQGMDDNRTDKGKPLPQEKIYSAFLKEKFKEGEDTELPSIFLVKFNGRHIMEMAEYRESYLNLVYYDLFERYFVEDKIIGKTCHACREMKEVIGNIPLTMKFYGTTNELYFENLKGVNAYKSFALCKECLAEVMAGMKYVENHLPDRIFDMDCYLIPRLIDSDSGFEEKLKGVSKIIKNRESRYRDHIDHLESLIKKSGKAGRSFYFDLLFYFTKQQEFNILKYISNIELKRLLEKMQKFDYFTDQYLLDQVGKYDSSLRLNDIRYYIFPSSQSHEKPDFKIFGKDLLNFLENFLNEHRIGYQDLIHKFTDIYRRRFNRDRIDSLSPFIMLLFITILHQIDILKEEKPMKKGHSISEVNKQEYRDFFQAHCQVYEENNYRQGLFLLGTVISRIVYAQKGKKATFMKKINLAGIPAHRVKNLIGDVKEYASIYTIFEDPGIWGNIMDRLQGIENSGMKGDEIVFYILTGISYEDYLGMKYGMEKKLKQEA